MPDAPTSSGAEGAAPSTDAKTATSPPEPPSAASLLQANVQLISKTVQSRETRLGLGRLMRQTTAVRKRLTPDVMAAFLSSTLPPGNQTQSFLEPRISRVRPHPSSPSRFAALCTTPFHRAVRLLGQCHQS